jgi:hypothetical protein
MHGRELKPRGGGGVHSRPTGMAKNMMSYPKHGHSMFLQRKLIYVKDKRRENSINHCPKNQKNL